MSKVTHIIRREYLANVRRRSFVISTILVPIIMAAFFVIPMMFAALEPAKTYRVDVVDQTGVMGANFANTLTDTLKNGQPKYVVNVAEAPGDSFATARAAHIERIRKGVADIVVAVPSTILTDGKASYITREERNMNVLDRFQKALTDVVIRRRLADEGLDYVRVQSLTTDVTLDMQQVSKSGSVEHKSFLADYGLVFVFTMILYSALLSWGTNIAKSIVEEKGSRIIEVLLSAVTPRQLMVGKLVGVGLAGLTQLGTWAVLGMIFATYASMGTIAMLASFHIAPVVFIYLIVFFILGFTLFSALFMTVGAVSSTDQDAQQLQALINLPLIVPILCLVLLIQNPASPLAVILSLIPVFAPMVMLARIILLQPPAWQIALSVALILGSIYLAVSFAARIFRVGILMYGKRPSLREMVHWYRLAR